MARVNVGVEPKYLTDQWLVAESVEITMITGGLRKHGYQIKSAVPESFVMGPGHINFFKTKLKYLQARLRAVNIEMRARGFNPGTTLEDLSEFPQRYHCDWVPTQEDSDLLRERLVWKIEQKPLQWRYKKEYVTDTDKYCDMIMKAPLYHV